MPILGFQKALSPYLDTMVDDSAGRKCSMFEGRLFLNVVSVERDG